tara:strand:- start:78 stop:293 length:216 start_codon:yes stop_codon:yes gene_type:complete
MKFNMDLKTLILVVTTACMIAGLYYTAKNDVNTLSLKVKGVQAENHDLRKRLDALDKKTNRMNKQLRGLKK